jgi:hypothetical protein
MITNETTFPFDLSTHAAFMLVRGIEEYIKDLTDSNELPTRC